MMRPGCRATRLRTWHPQHDGEQQPPRQLKHLPPAPLRRVLAEEEAACTRERRPAARRHGVAAREVQPGVQQQRADRPDGHERCRDALHSAVRGGAAREREVGAQVRRAHARRRVLLELHAIPRGEDERRDRRHESEGERERGRQPRKPQPVARAANAERAQAGAGGREQQRQPDEHEWHEGTRGEHRSEAAEEACAGHDAEPVELDELQVRHPLRIPRWDAHVVHSRDDDDHLVEGDRELNLRQQTHVDHRQHEPAQPAQQHAAYRRAARAPLTAARAEGGRRATEHKSQAQHEQAEDCRRSSGDN